MASSQHLPSGALLMGGKYKVGHILGQGTFGITYMAVTKMAMTGNLGTREMEVTVAVKEFFLHDFNKRETSTPNVSGTDSELFTVYRRKFRKEALNLTKLSHPGIVRVLDVFDENDTTYYAMEFVDGENLDDYISRKGSLPVEEAVETMTEIGSALDYMHSKKMLHLDIKPRNIMRKSDGTFRLIDFGLSKSFDGTGFSESSSNIGLGTPGYAPIEQSAGRKDGSFPVTMDVYALGATLFKMLTGERPPVSTEIFNDGFPEETLKEKGVPTEIIEVVRKAMSPAVGQRYQSVSALLADLQKAFLAFTESDGNEVEVVDVDMPLPAVIDEYPIGDDSYSINEKEEIENNSKNNPENPRQPLPTDEPTDNTDFNQTSQPPEGESQQDKIEVEPPKTAKKREGLIILFIVLLTAGIFAAILLITSETGPTDKIGTTKSEMVKQEKKFDQPSDKTETSVTGTAEITQNEIIYSLNWSNKTAAVKKASRDITTANIPAEINCNGVNFKVTEIGAWAFSSCSNLTSVNIPESVTKIGKQAFCVCENLTLVDIPSSVTEIGPGAFGSCYKLTEIKVDSQNHFFCSIDGVLYSKDKTEIIAYPAGKKGAFTIPISVTKIWEEAFRYCSNLTSVKIPDSVTEIGESAFYECRNLTSVKIPNRVTEIGESAFYCCYNLTSVTIPNSVTKIGAGAFGNCYSLTSVKIPDSVKEIGAGAFGDCDLTSVKIPDSVREIGPAAFGGCDKLTDINVDSQNRFFCAIDGGLYTKDKTKIIAYPGGKYGAFSIPSGVTKIGNYAFYDCSNLTSVTIPYSVTEIGKQAFLDCKSLTSITIPSSVTEIGEEAFWRCSSLTSVTIPNSVTEIGWRTFYECRNLTSVKIPDSVKEIGWEAFSSCKNLTSVKIPDSVREIGGNAFLGCEKLDVTYPASAKIGENAFKGCRSATPRN